MLGLGLNSPLFPRYFLILSDSKNPRKTEEYP